MGKGGTMVTSADSTKETFVKTGGEKSNDKERFMHWGVALDEERRKRSPEFFCFFSFS